jgi:hypothetical protein
VAPRPSRGEMATAQVPASSLAVFDGLVGRTGTTT